MPLGVREEKSVNVTSGRSCVPMQGRSRNLMSSSTTRDLNGMPEERM